MTPPTLLELARQGDPQAIAALLNRLLQPKAITARVAIREENCLHVLLESADTVPDRQAFLELVRKELTYLEPESIERVKVYGRKIGEKEPAWSQDFGLDFGAFSMLLAAGAEEFNSDFNSANSTSNVDEIPQKNNFVNKKSVAQLAVVGISTVLLLAALAVFSQKFINGFGKNQNKDGELQTPTLNK